MSVVLETEGLTKRFGDLVAVDELSLQVLEGEVFGFLGPNGAGKSTAISMMCGLLRPDSGRVLVHGELVDGGSPTVLARVGMCPQETILWDKLTCLEQLEFVGGLYGLSPKTSRERGALLLEALGLSAKAKALAGGLSGGMKRRLHITLALVHDPEIVIFDEPEAGLDPQSRVLVREYIRSLARHKTVILTTHNMDEADRLADRVAIIDRGRLLVLDTPGELKRTIGEGDVLELELPQGTAPQTALEIAKCIFAESTVHDRTLAVRGRNLIDGLSPLLQALAQDGITPSDVQLRANSLEDVFLSLTGRGLRE